MAISKYSKGVTPLRSSDRLISLYSQVASRKLKYVFFASKGQIEVKKMIFFKASGNVWIKLHNSYLWNIFLCSNLVFFFCIIVFSLRFNYLSWSHLHELVGVWCCHSLFHRSFLNLITDFWFAYSIK